MASSSGGLGKIFSSALFFETASIPGPDLIVALGVTSSAARRSALGSLFVRSGLALAS
jgi:hypothetical protein